MLGSGIFFCVPVSEFWVDDAPTRRRHCLPEGPVWLLNAGLQILTDAIILIMPIPVLLSLQMPCGPKACIVLVFSVGFR